MLNRAEANDKLKQLDTLEERIKNAIMHVKKLEKKKQDFICKETIQLCCLPEDQGCFVPSRLYRGIPYAFVRRNRGNIHLENLQDGSAIFFDHEERVIPFELTND